MPSGECALSEYQQDLARERVRFDVSPDGSVEGDDGAGGHLAETLRYVCRMGSQVGELLGLGELERLCTVSSLAVMARVSGVSPLVSIRAEVEVREMHPPELAVVAGLGVQEAIDRALRRVTDDFASDWAAVITEDARLVGAMHDESLRRDAPESLTEVGIRVLAVLGALDESLRETAVRFDYLRGSLLVMAIGGHALYTHADKFEASEMVRTVSAVQCLLAGADLPHAESVTASRRA